MVVDMIEPLSRTFDAFLGQIDNLFAEATPEPGLAISYHPLCLETVLYPVPVGAMFMLQVSTVVLFLVVYRALPILGWVAGTLFTFPALWLEVLRVLVAFPIILAAESFITFVKGTAVWSMMALQMLLQVAGPRICLLTCILWAEVRATTGRSRL